MAVAGMKMYRLLRRSVKREELENGLKAHEYWRDQLPMRLDKMTEEELRQTVQRTRQQFFLAKHRLLAMLEEHRALLEMIHERTERLVKEKERREADAGDRPEQGERASDREG